MVTFGIVDACALAVPFLSGRVSVLILVLITAAYLQKIDGGAAAPEFFWSDNRLPVHKTAVVAGVKDRLLSCLGFSPFTSGSS